VTYREAIRKALRDALAADDRVFLMGEDVGRYGGAFAVSHGLLEEFGPERIRDTPLCESAFVGAGIGSALAGMRPVVEVMTINFSLLALDQVVNNAAALRYMSGGQFSIPLVVRMATGGGRQMAAQHAHSLEGWYAHIPGITALAPATVSDAYWMLTEALADPDPVFLFEHATLYPLEGEIEDRPPDPHRAAVRRPGADVTVAAYGASVWRALEAAEELAARSVELEVVDLRCLRPLDMEAVLASVERTHRLVIVDEGWRTGSLAAEVSAQTMERGFDDLDAPVERVCSAEVPMPYAKHLEDAVMPSAGRIVAAVEAVTA
jgi:pyruvate dehydrogenase E1 component beta subunit